MHFLFPRVTTQRSAPQLDLTRGADQPAAPPRDICFPPLSPPKSVGASKQSIHAPARSCGIFLLLNSFFLPSKSQYAVYFFFFFEQGSFFVNATMYTNACDLSSRAPGHGSGQPHLIGGNRRLDALHGQVDGGIVQVCNFSVVAATPCRRHDSRGRVPHRWGEARSARAVVGRRRDVSARAPRSY